MPGWKCWTGGCNRGCSDEPARLSVGARGLLPPAVVALVLVGLWQALHGVAGPDLVSSPGETLAALGRLMGTARFWLDVRETGLAFVWALLLSVALGIGLGVVFGLSRASGDVAEPLLVTFYSLPKVTLYPVVLLVFGLGVSAKVAFGVMHGLVPITLLTRNAIRQLKPVYWRSATVMGLGRVATVRRVVLPAIVPDLVAGTRIAFSLSLLGVLIGRCSLPSGGWGSRR